MEKCGERFHEIGLRPRLPSRSFIDEIGLRPRLPSQLFTEAQSFTSINDREGSLSLSPISSNLSQFPTPKA